MKVAMVVDLERFLNIKELISDKIGLRTKTKDGGNKADDDEGRENNNQADETVGDAGTGGRNVFRIAFRENIIKGGEDQVGKKTKADKEKHEVEEVEAASAARDKITEIEGAGAEVGGRVIDVSDTGLILSE